jgi:hypothetical protein
MRPTLSHHPVGTAPIPLMLSRFALKNPSENRKILRIRGMRHHCGFSIRISPRSSVSPGLTVNSLRRTPGLIELARSVKR